jgi:putative redox protein
MVTIRATLAEGTAVQITNGRHEWRGDEPPSAGGTDTGPTPYELLLGSLAACTVITLVLYTRHKGIDISSISASYEFDRIHAKDCEDCEDDQKGFIDRITSNVEIGGQFDDAQRQRLTQIVSRCPVHKTLEKPVKMYDDVRFV